MSLAFEVADEMTIQMKVIEQYFPVHHAVQGDSNFRVWMKS